MHEKPGQSGALYYFDILYKTRNDDNSDTTIIAGFAPKMFTQITKVLRLWWMMFLTDAYRLFESHQGSQTICNMRYGNIQI